MNDILASILTHKRTEIDAAKNAVSVSELQRRSADAPPVRHFVQSLRDAAFKSTLNVGLIAEVKKASPSAGIIRENFDPVRIARLYESSGAACLSVLTDEKFFGGRLEYLEQIRAEVDIPVMRKEFILDRYQILEARCAGADCVLLIAECLDDEMLADLYEFTGALGMHALIEIYEPENLDRVLSLNPPLIGINNRNLKTFETSLDHTIRLAERIPSETILVSESGIRSRDDVQRLAAANVSAILVGETLMRAEDIAAKVRELSGSSNSLDSD